MRLRKIFRIIRIMFLFELRRLRYYPFDYILNVVSKIVYLVLNILFWYVVKDVGLSMKGWQYNDIIVFLAFSELFYGLDASVFTYASRFWMYIYSGTLDNTLTRPMNSQVRFLLLNVDYIGIILNVVEFISLIIISKNKFTVLNITIGILAVVGANVILALMRLCGSYVAFWHGKVSAISEMSDCLTSFNKYPFTIMPKPLIYAFKFVFPFYFFSTFSAEIVCFKVSKESLIKSVSGFVSLIVLWTLVNRVLWKKGLERYESVNG